MSGSDQALAVSTESSTRQAIKAAWRHAGRGRLKSALEELTRASRSGSAEEAILAAMAFREIDIPERAAAIADDAWQRYPTVGVLLYVAVDSYLAAGQTDSARRIVDRALYQRPADLSTRCAHVWLLVRCGNRDHAVAALSDLEREAPESAEVGMMRAFMTLAEGRRIQAARTACAAWSGAATEPSVHFLLYVLAESSAPRWVGWLERLLPQRVAARYVATAGLIENPAEWIDERFLREPVWVAFVVAGLTIALYVYGWTIAAVVLAAVYLIWRMLLAIARKLAMSIIRYLAR